MQGISCKRVDTTKERCKPVSWSDTDTRERNSFPLPRFLSPEHRDDDKHDRLTRRERNSATTISSRDSSVKSRGSRVRNSGSHGLLSQSTSSSHSSQEDGPKKHPTSSNTHSTASAAAAAAIHCNSYSLSSKLAKWTRKVQGSLVTCGGTLVATATQEEISVTEEDSQSQPSMNIARSKSGKRSSEDCYDHDHHTFATATTASATISYSTDQGDDASEMGMEVIMSSATEGLETNVTTMLAMPYRSHSIAVGKHTFVVDERYTMIRAIGSGAYGVVISARDSKANRNVAIKMVPKAFSDEVDAKRILREIKLLKHLRHENIVQLVDMMPPNVGFLEDYKDVYLVADLMETDLHRIIYSKQKLSIDHVQYFIYQVLKGLKYIHSCKVLHRDLKPSNLLVNSNCDLKICDFGLARGIHQVDKNRNNTMFLTEYVVTRWYRAPEIMLACHEYSYPVDVWSVGCIFAELILRKPYFPGDDYIDQVRLFAFLILCLCCYLNYRLNSRSPFYR